MDFVRTQVAVANRSHGRLMPKLRQTRQIAKKSAPRVHDRGRPLGYQASRSPGAPLRSDIAFALLQTCRAVYFETYTLPVSCNPYVVQNCYHSAEMKKFLPWQYAAIQRLDIDLIQASLEGDCFWDYLFEKEKWNLGVRNESAYVAPKRHVVQRQYEPFDLVPTPATSKPDQRKLLDQQKLLCDVIRDASSCLSDIDVRLHAEDSSFRVMLARPITHLTLRLAADSWWTWTDDPETITATE